MLVTGREANEFQGSNLGYRIRPKEGYVPVAPPDTLFFGGDGVERHALQLTGPEDPDKFLKRIAAAAK